MNDTTSVRRWVTFAGAVLVVAVLSLAQEVLVPVALAILFAFVLATPTAWLQRLVGRVPAVLVVSAVTFGAVGLGSWAVFHELTGLARELPGYRNNILQKVEDVRKAGTGGVLGPLERLVQQVSNDTSNAAGGPIGSAEASSVQPAVTAVAPFDTSSRWRALPWLGPLMQPVARAGFVVVLVIFMLLERASLRDRLITLAGHRSLAVTSRAFDEAGTLVSRQLTMQTVVNVTFGAGVSIGLFLIGVPYPLLWGGLAGVLRFIPYVGPVIGSAGPILTSLAALPGWTRPVWVVALFFCLEVFTNVVLETVLYAGSAGISQVALLISVAFWAWLWGPLGLLMATPLTIGLVVLGRNVHGLEFVETLMAKAPTIAPDVRFYQRLVARDFGEAAELIDDFGKTNLPESVYDLLLLPALNYAERDRLQGSLSADEEAGVLEAMHEHIADASAMCQKARESDPREAGEAKADAPTGPLVAVLGSAASSGADELALGMLRELLRGSPVSLDITTGRLSAETVALVQEGKHRIVCIADLPPHASSRARYLVKKLRAAAPHVQVAVGRWAPPALADADSRLLTEAGASHIGSTLVETRDYLVAVAQALGITDRA